MSSPLLNKKTLDVTHRKHERNSRNPRINLCKYKKKKEKKGKKKFRNEDKTKKEENTHHITNPVESVQTTNEFTILTKFGLFLIHPVGMSEVCW